MQVNYSFTAIFFRFKWKISLTILLVIAESIIGIFYPLAIGFAINDLLEKSFNGLYHLAILGALSLFIGSLRRFYDTRVYSRIYLKTVTQMIANEKRNKRDASSISARANLMTEFVEFLENSMPDIVGSIIAIVGVLIIIATLNVSVFYACIVLLMLISITYWLSGSKNYTLNKGYNDELERQVSAISGKSALNIHQHFRALMRWNIALSDLETINYFIVWFGVIMLLIYTPVQVVGEGVLSYGLVFSILMYVFDYIERLVTLPLHIQQMIRLHEISKRLKA